MQRFGCSEHLASTSLCWSPDGPGPLKPKSGLVGTTHGQDRAALENGMAGPGLDCLSRCPGDSCPHYRAPKDRSGALGMPELPPSPLPSTHPCPRAGSQRRRVLGLSGKWVRSCAATSQSLGSVSVLNPAPPEG